MTLWNKEKADGAADYDDSKPNWLSEEEKARCYCDDRGWVLVHLNGTEEVLVAGSGLNNSNAPADATQKQAAADHLSTVSFSDDDSDGKPEYQDPDDGDPE